MKLSKPADMKPPRKRRKIIYPKPKCLKSLPINKLKIRAPLTYQKVNSVEFK